ncbi:uncharacterized protein PWA37_001370 [Arxiozyma heterogenica]|uniref:uncharacterized protein n=1 Tax=Arxiozyma heterogenica TaxID=278026 RepID=UPI002EEB8DE1
MTVKSKDDKIRDFCKLQHACQQFLESLKIIYDLGVTHEELEDMVNGEDAVDQALAVSPCMSIASYLKLLKDSVNLMEIYDYYEFDPNETPVDEFITMEHILPLDSSSNRISNNNNIITEDMDRLKIDTNDVGGSTKNMTESQISNTKKSNDRNENSSNNPPQPTKKISKSDLSLSANSNNANSKNNNKQSSNKSTKKENNNNKNNQLFNKVNNNDNKKNNKKKNPNNNFYTPQLNDRTRRLDPSLDDNSNPSSLSSYKRSGSASNNNSYKNNNNSSRKFSKSEKAEDINTEISLKLDAALGKYKLAPEYTTRQLKNGSFETTCRIKGLNTIVSKGYGRDRTTAQHNAANMAFTSQTLLDILSSKV